jgi:hypothetical protein
MRRGAASCRAVATRARSSRQRAVTVPWRSRCPELASRLLVPLSASLSAVWASGVQASSVHGFWVSSVRCRASGVQASSVHAFGCPGVRASAVRASGSRVRGLRIRAVRTASGLVAYPDRAWPGPAGDGRAWLALVSIRPPLPRPTACGARLAAWPTKGPGPAPGCRPVGWEAPIGSRCAQRPPTWASEAGAGVDGRPPG